MIEEHFVGNETGDGEDLEPGEPPERFVHPREIGNSARGIEPLDAVEKLVRGVARHQVHLATVKPPPAVVLLGRVLGERLLDGIVRPNTGVVAAQGVGGSLRWRVIGVHGVGRLTLHHHIMWEFEAASLRVFPQ